MKVQSRHTSTRNHWLLVWACLGLAAAGLIFFSAFVANPTEWRSLLATLVFGSSTALTALILGGLISCSLGRETLAARFSLIISVFNFCLPIYWHLAAWDAAFGQLGWWSAFSDNPLHMAIPRWLAAIWVQATAAAPCVALLILIFQLDTGRAADEQGLLDGSPWQVFWRITARRQFPLWALVVCWVFVVSSREIAVTDIYQIGTVAEQVYLGFALGQADQLLMIWPEGSSVISIRLYFALIVWIGTLAWLVIASLNRWNWSGELIPARSRVPGSAWRFRLGMLVNLVLTTVPFANLIFRAGLRVEATSAGPTPNWSFSALSESLIRATMSSTSEFLWSAAISISAATILLFGSILFVGFATHRRKIAWGLMGTIVLTLALPGPVIGAILARSWSVLDYSWAWWLADRTIFLPVCACLVYCWPLAALSVWIGIGTTPREVEESAELQGLDGWQRFLSLHVAGRKKYLAGLGLLLLMLSFGELSAQQMVAAAGIDTIPRLLLGWMHSGVDELAAATSLLVAIFMGLLTLVMVWLWKLPVNARPR